MRRPSPLPPPAESSGRGGEDTEVDDVASRVAPPWLKNQAQAPDERPADEAADDDDLADVLPLESSPRASTADPSTSSDGAGAGELPGDGFGIREVWAAARARRRALRAEVRRFTARQRRRRNLWIGAGVAIVALVLGTIGAAYSPLFAVERVRVVGADGLDAAAVEQALAGQLGTPLPLVDSGAVKDVLVGFPLVESYTLEARPPHELVVRIVERTPIGVIESSSGFTLVDAAGVALSTAAEAPEGHPTLDITGGVGSNAFRAVGRVFRSLPVDIREQVTAITATTPNDVTLTMGETDTDIVWGNADDSADKALALEKIMQAIPPAEVSVYDVSSPNAVVVS